MTRMALPGALRRFLIPGLFVVALFAVLVHRRDATRAGAPKDRTIWVFEGRTFGTTFTVKVVPAASGSARKRSLSQAFTRILERIDRQMSTWRKDSDLSGFNRSRSTAPMKVSPELLKVVAAARRVALLTGGAFDVTIGPVVNLWGFGPVEPRAAPSAAQVAAARRLVGVDKLLLDERASTLAKRVPGLYVDLSAIAKGYAVDQLGEAIERAGHRDYLVEIGGELRARGTNRLGEVWRAGVERPGGGPGQNVHEVIELSDASMATSGNYRNYRKVGARRISHIIDARTCEPVRHRVASVTVIHGDCMTADALATAFFVLGVREGMQLANRNRIAVLFLTPAGEGFRREASRAFEARVRSRKT